MDSLRYLKKKKTTWFFHFLRGEAQSEGQTLDPAAAAAGEVGSLVRDLQEGILERVGSLLEQVGHLPELADSLPGRVGSLPGQVGSLLELADSLPGQVGSPARVLRAGAFRGNQGHKGAGGH